MTKKNILVTGGAGYIGSHVNCMLAEHGYNTIVLDDLSGGFAEFVQWGRLIQGDIGDRSILETIFTEHKIDAVMHFAGFINVGESVTEPEKYYTNNISSSLTLLNTMKKHKVDKIIFSSTCAVYGQPQFIPLTEKHQKVPINPYGRTKLIFEHALEDYSSAYNLRYAALRYFNAAGADRQCRMGEKHNPETHLIPLALLAALDKKRTLSVYGTDYDTPDGTCIRDYIHVTDLAKAHVLALEYLLKGGESNTFNLGCGEGFSVQQVLDCARMVTGQDIQVAYGPRRAGDPPRLIGAAQKAGTILGWTPRYTDLEDIVATAWAFVRTCLQNSGQDG